MPEAVDSNSINTPEIHPLYLLDALDDISNALHAYRIVLVSMLDSGSGFADSVSHGVGLMLDCVINRFDALVTMQGDKKSIKPLRDKFILEQLEQGFTVEQISQALNMRLSIITRTVEKPGPGPQYQQAAV